MPTDRALTTEEIASWFLAHYEHPANSCPHDSREGGFQYIYGGPYDATEEITSNYAITERQLADVLRTIGDEDVIEWSGTPETCYKKVT